MLDCFKEKECQLDGKTLRVRPGRTLQQKKQNDIFDSAVSQVKGDYDAHDVTVDWHKKEIKLASKVVGKMKRNSNDVIWSGVCSRYNDEDEE